MGEVEIPSTWYQETAKSSDGWYLFVQVRNMSKKSLWGHFPVRRRFHKNDDITYLKSYNNVQRYITWKLDIVSNFMNGRPWITNPQSRAYLMRKHLYERLFLMLLMITYIDSNLCFGDVPNRLTCKNKTKVIYTQQTHKTIKCNNMFTSIYYVAKSCIHT